MNRPLLDLLWTYAQQPLAMSIIIWFLGWALMLIIGLPLVGWLKHRKGMKWAPREDTPDSHLQKAGVPSMGGIGIIGAAVIAWITYFVFTSTVYSFAGGSNDFKGVALFAIFPLLVVSHAILGYLDDYSKAINRGGLSSKAKFLGQVILAICFLGIIFLINTKTGSQLFATSPKGQLTLWESPLFNSWLLILGALLIIIGTSNAVNLTDGIDGLAAGLSVQVALAFCIFSLDPNVGASSFERTSVFFFWPALGGACLGFLAFNKYPAKIFMGDTGSLALGAALGAGAILTRTVWLLPFIGFIFYVEMFSVIAQVLYFKYTRKKFGEGKRLFRRAPLHHHFELCGWSEWRVVATFWGVNLVTTILGLILWKMGILPRFP